MQNWPDFVCLPAKNQFFNLKKSRFFGFFDHFSHVFLWKCDFRPKVIRKYSKCFFSDSLHPEDHFYAFLSNFGEFEILKFLRFSWLKSCSKSNNDLGCTRIHLKSFVPKSTKLTQKILKKIKNFFSKNHSKTHLYNLWIQKNHQKTILNDFYSYLTINQIFPKKVQKLGTKTP